MRSIRWAFLSAAVLAGCGDDHRITGPGEADPTCERWELVSIDGQSVPASSPGLTIVGGSIDLLCTGWYRLANETDPPFTRIFVGRYEVDGATIRFLGGADHGPMTGTVSGTSLEVISAGRAATYARRTLVSASHR